MLHVRNAMIQMICLWVLK